MSRNRRQPESRQTIEVRIASYDESNLRELETLVDRYLKPNTVLVAMNRSGVGYKTCVLERSKNGRRELSSDDANSLTVFASGYRKAGLYLGESWATMPIDWITYFAEEQEELPSGAIKGAIDRLKMRGMNLVCVLPFPKEKREELRAGVRLVS